ncbi:acyl-CoA dehydrogenase family protein, partial [Neorhizobium sp. Rsf11]
MLLETVSRFVTELVQAMLADSEADTYAARCMILDAAARRDLGENTTKVAACAK